MKVYFLHEITSTPWTLPTRDAIVEIWKIQKIYVWSRIFFKKNSIQISIETNFFLFFLFSIFEAIDME